MTLSAVISMTGFGAAEATAAGRTYRLEVKCVNHRNLSLRVSLPPELSSWEHDVRAEVKRRLIRGAVDVSVRLESAEAGPPEIAVDIAAAQAMTVALQDLASHVGTGSPSLDLVLRYGDVIRVTERRPDQAVLDGVLAEGLRAALDAALEMRRREGAALAKDMQERLTALDDFVGAVEASAPEVLAKQQARLSQRAQEAQVTLGVAADPQRLAAELVVYADRADVTEEVVRARAHLARFRAIMADGSAAEHGKRLDFLSQELLRELNTMGSKCRDAAIAQRVVDAKVELEKVREQVQNIL